MDKLKVRGDVKIITKNSSGQTLQYEEKKNMVVDVGLDQLARLLTGDETTAMGYIAVGTGTTAPAAGNTELEVERKREAVTPGNATSGVATFEKEFTFETGEEWSITEAGLFDAAASGNMFDRFTFSAKAVEPGIALTIIITITFERA